MTATAVRNPDLPRDEDFRTELAARVLSMIGMADGEEASRRRSDQIGGNIYYGRHWMVPMPKNRAAITANVSKALVDHKIAIMTKQDPIPVVEPDDVGDIEAARLMRFALQRAWHEMNMRLKSRQALRLCNNTRTCAGKALWDPTLKGGAGDCDVDVIPGWRLILDPRTRFVDRMEFIGDRARMSRTRAMRLYPQVAPVFSDAGDLPKNTLTQGGNSSSPVKSQFSAMGFDTPSAGGTLINGKPVVTAFTGRGPTNPGSEYEVEVIELYHRDRTLVKKFVPAKDPEGNEQRKIARDKDGAPMFEQTADFDPVLGEPGFRLMYEPIMREELVPKYPYWRRTTLLMPEGSVIDDRAWDEEQPYELLLDNEPLEGPWSKGSILDIEELQAQLNVSLSTMVDNLRFSAYRAFKASTQAQIERNNLVLSPGDIVRVGSDISQFMPIEFPQLSEAWFNWCNFTISLMERIIGATGIMQGEAAGRVDSAAGYDTLAEIGGSRIVESTQRYEIWIAGLMRKVGRLMQKYYTEKHAVRVEDHEGNLTWERAAAPQLMGTFSYRVAVGSTLAWNESGVRQRVIQEMQEGLRDRISAWQALHIPDWQLIKQRMESQNPIFNPAPPPRTRVSTGKKSPNSPRPHG